MKRNLLKLSLVFFIFPLLSGCIASHVGNMTGSASLDAPNFMYKKQDVYGTSKAVYVLGIGGVARQSLILEAKRNMLKANPLRNNQALANVAVSYKSSAFLGFIVTTVNCTVSADIVEFDTPQIDLSQPQSQNPESLYGENFSEEDSETQIENTEIDTKTPINVGDKVNVVHYFNRPVNGKVIEINDRGYVVEYERSNGRFKQVTVLEFQVEKSR